MSKADGLGWWLTRLKILKCQILMSRENHSVIIDELGMRLENELFFQIAPLRTVLFEFQHYALCPILKCLHIKLGLSAAPVCYALLLAGGTL